MEQLNMQCTIIYCQKQETCTAIFTFLAGSKGEFKEPVGYPDLPQFCMVDMFTSGTHTSEGEHCIVIHKTFV